MASRSSTVQRTPTWEKAFLTTLAKLGNVTRACEAAGIDRKTAYNRRDSHEAFKAAWDEALDEAADQLEAEAWRRAVEGTDEPVFQKGEKVGMVRRYSDTLMALLLKAHKPEKYRERQDVTSDGEKIQTITVVEVVKTHDDAV